jgi:hypothetical protein
VTSKVDLLGIGLVVYGAMALLVAMMPLLVAAGSGLIAAIAGASAVSGDPDAPAALVVFGLYAGIFGLFGIFAGLLGFAAFVVAFGVFRRKSWARVGGSVFAIVAGMTSMGVCFPLGMAVGMLLIVGAILVLVDKDAAREFDEASQVQPQF